MQQQPQQMMSGMPSGMSSYPPTNITTEQIQKVMASKTRIYIVLEFVDGGELFDKIAKNGRLKEDDARSYFLQLINVVDYCHSRGVYHRDLKPENLLLDSYGVLKISDFGLSTFEQQVQTMNHMKYLLPGRWAASYCLWDSKLCCS